MTKQLMIYEKVTPVNKKKHRNLSVKVGGNYEFARSINASPLMATEFTIACFEYPIVFVGKGDNIMPIAILGMKEQQNLFISDDGSMDANYIPAFFRRYPFVFSTPDNGANPILCIDESFEGCNEEGIGERLFDAEGEQSQYLKGTLKFLEEYQVHSAKTQMFCKKLSELELLEPVANQSASPDNDQKTSQGFMAINRQKLHSLPGEQYQSLAKTGALELAYAHLQSLKNFAAILKKIKLKETE